MEVANETSYFLPRYNFITYVAFPVENTYIVYRVMTEMNRALNVYDRQLYDNCHKLVIMKLTVLNVIVTTSDWFKRFIVSIKRINSLSRFNCSMKGDCLFLEFIIHLLSVFADGVIEIKQ